MALVAYGGTFMDSEVNELRALKKAVVFCLLLIPYWMIYTQVTENEVLRHVSNSTAKHLLVMYSCTSVSLMSMYAVDESLY